MEKKELVQRLYDEKKITFDEMLLLMQPEKEVEFVPQPYPVYPQPIQPIPNYWEIKEGVTITPNFSGGVTTNVPNWFKA